MTPSSLTTRPCSSTSSGSPRLSPTLSKFSSSSFVRNRKCHNHLLAASYKTMYPLSLSEFSISRATEAKFCDKLGDGSYRRYVMDETLF